MPLLWSTSLATSLLIRFLKNNKIKLFDVPVKDTTDTVTVPNGGYSPLYRIKSR